MRTDFWRQGAAAILAAGLLASAVIAQEGASGEVKIEGEKPPAAAGETAKPAGKPAKPTITDRDPFVNQVHAGVVSENAITRVRPKDGAGGSDKVVKPGPRPGPGGKAGASGKGGAEEVVEEVIVPAPEVTITGIVKSGGGHIAIVNSGTQSYMVTQGQKLGDYRVSTITDTAVTFTHTGKAFKVPIESFSAAKK